MTDGTIQALRHQIIRATTPITNDVAGVLLRGRSGLTEAEQVKRLQVFAAAAHAAQEHGENVSDEVFAAVDAAVQTAEDRKVARRKAESEKEEAVTEPSNEDLDSEDDDEAEKGATTTI